MPEFYKYVFGDDQTYLYKDDSILNGTEWLGRAYINRVKLEPFKNLIIATVGLPRSGKSTWVRDLGVPIVSPDSVRLAFYKERWRADMEAWVWPITQVMIDSLFESGHKVIAYDATNYTQEIREKFIRNNSSRDIHWVCFKVPVNECIKRAIDTSQEDLVPIIERMNVKLTFPRDLWYFGT